MQPIKMLHIGQCHTQAPFSSLQNALMKHVDYRFVSSSDPDINKLSVEEAKTFKPDICFIHIQSPNVITEDTVCKIKESGAWTANWTGDARDPIPRWFLEIGRHIDLTLFSNEEDAIALRNHGIPAGYLQIGIDETIYNPKGRIGSGHDVVFMANNYGEFPLSRYRKELAESLRYNLKNNFGLYGSGWKFSNGNYYRNQEGEAETYRASKIAINVSHFDLERYSSDRIFRIMGSGCFCLCKYYPGYYRDFENKKHLVIWETETELFELIKYYLEHEKEREEIAKAGQVHVHKHFKFDNTVTNLLELYHASH